MSLLTLDVGGAALSVNCQRAGHAPPRKVGGDRSTTFAGSENAATRAEAMVVPVVLARLSPTTVATIRAMFALGAQVPCAGDVFNNGGVTEDWSAVITDELHETADHWTISMTLYEVNPATASTPITTFIYPIPTVSVDDPGDSSIRVALVGGPGGGPSNTGNVRLLDATPAVDLECGVTPDPNCNCAIVYSTAPEKSWMTLPIAQTQIAGLMTLTFLSKGGTGDSIQTQAVMGKIFLVRAGVDVASVTTAWSSSNGGFSGGSISMTTLGAVVWDVLDGDKIRIEAWARLGLHCGYADTNDGSDLSRQGITYGWGGAGFYSQLSVGGVVTLL